MGETVNLMSRMPDPAYIGGMMLMLGMVPFAAVLATSYTKLVIVFGLMRMALGTQQVPPNMVMNAMAIILTCFIMAPVGSSVAKIAMEQTGRSEPQQKRFDDLIRTVRDAAEPVKVFLVRHTREREKRLFLRAAEQIWPKSYLDGTQQNDLLVLVPSFALSEVTQAFQIGFILYLVFTVIDLLVASILLAMGMSMVSPATVATPFKLLLFIALDGWAYLIQGLLLTYK
jgi:type III secretion protein R